MTDGLVLIGFIAFAYALGALPLSYAIVRRWKGVDLHEEGSGNVGATNVMRTAGWPLGLLVLVFDVGKGALAVWIAERVLVSGINSWLGTDIIAGYDAAGVGAGIGSGR